MTRLRIGVVITVFVAAATAVRSAQTRPAGPQLPPAFRSSVDVTEVDVAVVDRDSRPVGGLTAADFALFENGRPQPIVAFAEVQVPAAPGPPAAWMRTVTPDVRSNRLGDGRLFAIVMDDATIPQDASIAGNARQIGRSLVAHLGPDDLASVVFVNDVRRSVDFTNDRARLLAAIDAFMPGFAYASGDPQTDSQFYFSSIRTLALVSARLAHVPQRRKAVVYVSTGVPLDLPKITKAGQALPLRPGQGVPVIVDTIDETTVQDLNIAFSDLLEQRPDESYGMAMREALIRAQYGNVNVYSMDPAGLGGMESYLQSRPRTTTTGSIPLPQVDAVNESRLRREFLRAVSEDSGGRAVMNTNSFEAGVARVFEDNSTYYLIGYQAEHDPADRTIRRVSVQTSRPGLTARTRNAYSSRRDSRTATAPGADPGPALRRALADVLPNPAVTLRAASAAFAVPGSRPGLAVALGVEQQVPGDSGARVNEALTLVATAFDPEGRPRAWFQQNVQLALRAGLGEPAVYEVLSRLDLDPGAYQVRLAAHSAMTGQTGSVYFDVVVPAFGRDALQLSGVALSCGESATTVTGEGVAALLPVLPTSRRTFTADDTVDAFLRIYQGDGRAPGVVSIAGTITDGRERVVRRWAGAVGAATFSNGQADYQWRVPVSELAAGEYLLTISATQGGKTVRRDVRFVVN
jgi:VWFA-related protein